MSRLVHHRLEGKLMRYLVLGFALVSGIVVTSKRCDNANADVRCGSDAGHGVSGETAAGSQDVPGAVHTEEVTGSIPVSPTSTNAPFRSWEGAFDYRF